METFKFDEEKTDVFIYIGEISRKGYSTLSQEIAKLENRKEQVLICMATFGGDPDAGYRIGRCLQHYYPQQVSLFAPSLCKSSGTLTAIAANNLIIGNQGELGPLDIQLRKADEIGEQSSGLDIFKAINFLEDRVVEQFVQYLGAIRFGSGVSTKLSADIAAKLVQSVIEPIASQIDPIKIGEHQRAIGIAQKYGELLNEMTKNLKERGLSTLIAGYPSHGFVIDRKEAEKLFNKVFKPCDTLINLLNPILPVCFEFRRLGNEPLVGHFLPPKEEKYKTNEVDKNETSEASEQQHKNDSSTNEQSNSGEPSDSSRTKSPSRRNQQKGT